MIFVTGDTHCPIDIHKLSSGNFPADGLTRDDYVIICGDAGLVWYGRDKEDIYWQKWLQDKPWTTLFVDGNHENHDALNEMPVSEWNGGSVHFIQPNVIHLMRGQVFTIDGASFFTMGGAASHDKEYRVPGKSWWEKELPCKEEYETALENLDKAGWKVDYVITHCCPTDIQKQIDADSCYEVNRLTDFFNLIDRKLDFKEWYFGHYHINSAIDNEHFCLYNKIVKLK